MKTPTFILKTIKNQFNHKIPVIGNATPVNGNPAPVTGNATAVNGNAARVNGSTTPVNGNATPVNESACGCICPPQAEVPEGRRWFYLNRHNCQTNNH